MVKKIVSVSLVVIGILLIGSGVALAVYNFWDDGRASDAASSVLDHLEMLQQAQIDSGAPSDPGASPIPEASGTAGSGSDLEPPTGGYIPDYQLNPNMDPPAVEIDGSRYIGTIELPNLGIKLPVHENWSYPNLKIAPCRFQGSPYLDNMIICGHNYTTHLGRIKNLQPGDPVIFTDMDGNVFRYQVTKTEIIDQTHPEQIPAGDWDLTLFTCTLARVTRVTVRCDRIEE